VVPGEQEGSVVRTRPWGCLLHEQAAVSCLPWCTSADVSPRPTSSESRPSGPSWSVLRLA